jgi:hypothetical protein
LGFFLTLKSWAFDDIGPGYDFSFSDLLRRVEATKALRTAGSAVECHSVWPSVSTVECHHVWPSVQNFDGVFKIRDFCRFIDEIK